MATPSTGSGQAGDDRLTEAAAKGSMGAGGPGGTGSAMPANHGIRPTSLQTRRGTGGTGLGGTVAAGVELLY